MHGQIDDGYGDHLTNGEVVERFRKWSHAVAGNVTNPYGSLYDDVVQEALIEIWRVLQVKGGKAAVSATYLTMSARRRMIDVAHGRPMVGGDRRPGPRTEPPVTQSLDVLLDSEAMTDLLAAPNILDGVALAYHYGEILAALSALPPRHRAYVVLRFWGGFTEIEIAARLDISRQALSTAWSREIRPILQSRLEHLVAP